MRLLCRWLSEFFWNKGEGEFAAGCAAIFLMEKEKMNISEKENMDEKRRKEDAAEESAGPDKTSGPTADSLELGEESEKSDTEAHTKTEPDSYQMVDVGHQPGSTRYQFATHAPAPGGEEGGDKNGAGKSPEGGWRDLLMDGEHVSAAFVVALLIIIAALFTGIMLASHRSRIMDLNERVEALESRLGEQE